MSVVSVEACLSVVRKYALDGLVKGGVSLATVYAVARSVAGRGVDPVDVVCAAALDGTGSPVSVEAVAAVRVAVAAVVRVGVVSAGGSVVAGGDSGGDDVAEHEVGGDSAGGLGAVDEDGLVLLGSSVSAGSECGSEGSSDSVVMPASGFLLTGVRTVLTNGGFSVFRPDDGVNRVVDAPQVWECARAPRVRALRQQLRSAGVMIPKSALGDLALASCSAACVPGCYERGRDALRVLEYVGDRALSLADAKRCYAMGIAVGSAQERASSKFSNAALSRAFAASGLVQHCAYPGGVDVGVGRVGAAFVEAIAGVIALHVASPDAVYAYMRLLKL